jgi:hypothetical protein
MLLVMSTTVKPASQSPEVLVDLALDAAAEAVADATTLTEERVAFATGLVILEAILHAEDTPAFDQLTDRLAAIRFARSPMGGRA